MTDLFTYQPPAKVAFDGITYDPDKDHTRLKGQLWKVFELLSDGKWHTLAEMKDYAGGSESGCSARLRDLRKPQYGAKEIQRERVAGGLWKYKMVVGNTSLSGGA